MLKGITLGEEFTYRYHYMDGKECEIKDGQLIENGDVRNLTLDEIEKLRKYENDLIKYNEFSFNQPLRNIEDLFNYNFRLYKPQIPCFCSFCLENPDDIRKQVTRIDFEKPKNKRRLDQNDYEDSFPTPGFLRRLDNNNDNENNDIINVFDLRSPTANDLCIVEDDIIIDGGRRREYTDEDRKKIKQYDKEVSHMISELKERLIKKFDEEIYKPDFHENMIQMIKDHSKNMPGFPCICESCRDNDEDNKVEPTDKPLPITSKPKDDKTKKDNSEEQSPENDERHDKSGEELPERPSKEATTDSSKESFF